jgi:hypothetical protein
LPALLALAVGYVVLWPVVLWQRRRLIARYRAALGGSGVGTVPA